MLFYFTVDYLKYFSRDVVLERIEDSGKMLTQQAIDDAVVAMTTQFGVSKVRMLIIELKVTKQKWNELVFTEKVPIKWKDARQDFSSMKCFPQRSVSF